jgi:hypothetical protein
MYRPLGFFLILVFATVVGCGSDVPKFANIKGTVTFNGKPIEKGKITFASPGRPPSTMDIDDGKFNGQAMVGENKVSVSAMKRLANAPKLPPQAELFMNRAGQRKEDAGTVGEHDPNAVDYIPQEWGLQGKQTRVVEPGSTNEFEFNIKSKN